MIRITHLVAALAVLLVISRNLNAQHAFDYERNLGVALAKDGRSCLEIKNEQLARGQVIKFINSHDPMTTGIAEIEGVSSEACIAANKNDPKLHVYTLKVVGGVLDRAAPAFAVAGSAGALRVTNTHVTGDLDNDGRSESFRSCTTTEGVYMTVWKGRPLKGTRKWRYYFYLGYDVSPTCTKRDTTSDSR